MTLLVWLILIHLYYYFANNKNKVYIGYSYTDKASKAIRGIAIKTEILSLNEPAASISVDGNNYDLVAEAADDVTSLPRAINLIGTDNSHDTLLPRMYLYYSTSVDNEPIYDITIDSDPIKNGWLTASSANVKNPFTDISAEAKKQEELATAENIERGNGNYAIYVDELCWWMADISKYFDPAEENLTPFYIHTNHYKDTTLEKENPYISEVFVAVGDTRHAALADMVQYGVDGFIDCDLNLEAGGDFVYLGYKRTDNVKEALTDLVVFEGDEPETNKRLDINGKSVKYTLASEVDLNSNAGGKWLYLYSSDAADTGNPIKGLRVEEKTVSYLKCGVEEATVKRAEGKAPEHLHPVCAEYLFIPLPFGQGVFFQQLLSGDHGGLMGGAQAGREGQNQNILTGGQHRLHGGGPAVGIDGGGGGGVAIAQAVINDLQAFVGGVAPFLTTEQQGQGDDINIQLCQQIGRQVTAGVGNNTVAHM